MKRKHYILGIFALICLLGTGAYAWRLRDAYGKQVEKWNEEAKVCFDDALWMEVNKRSEIPFYSYSSGKEGVSTLNARIPDSVSVMTMEGFRRFKIDRNEYEKSLVKETEPRVSLSTLLSKFPLSLDSLSSCWDNSLKSNGLPVQGHIRYIYTDLNLDNDTVFSNSGKQYSDFDSLTVRYLGFRCEHELAAFTSYPYWLLSLSKDDWCILLLPWLLLILLSVYYPRLESLAKRKLTHEKVIEKEIVVEKKIHLADVKIDKAQVFELPDGTIFDAFACTLEKDGLQQRLQPQSVSLLKLFLRENNHQVSSDSICVKLWGDASHTERLYSAIRRLRNDLRKVKSELFIESSYGVYELKSPISSKKPD